MGLKKFVVTPRKNLKTSNQIENHFHRGSISPYYQSKENLVISPIYISDEGIPLPLPQQEQQQQEQHHHHHRHEHDSNFDYENLEENKDQCQSNLNLDSDSLDESPQIGNDYYEGILFSDGLPKPVPDFAPRPEDQTQVDEEYEDVEVNELFDPIREPGFESHPKPCPQYENLPNSTATPSFKQHEQDIDAMLFSVGLRFPSIRIKDEEKKRAKREKSLKTAMEPVYSQPDKRAKCRSNVDIYDVVKNDLSKSTSTLRAEQKAKFALSERKSGCCSTHGGCFHRISTSFGSEKSFLATCRANKSLIFSTKFLCGIIIFSVFAFLIAGAVLLYQSLSGDVITYHAETAAAGQGALISAAPTTAPQFLVPSTADLPLFPVGPPTLFPTANWSPWSSWSTCSSKCQPGESHARSRSCLDNKGNSLSDLTACIILQGGTNIEIRLCPCDNIAISDNPTTAPPSLNVLKQISDKSIEDSPGTTTTQEPGKYYYKLLRKK